MDDQSQQLTPIGDAGRSDQRTWAHSARDGWLVLLALLQIAFTFAVAVGFNHLSVAAVLGAAVLWAFLDCTNYQCIAHNFIHNPFFRSKRLNALFSVANSVALGMPQTLYREHHLNHHKHNNDDRDPETGTTEDASSTYRFSKVRGESEPLWRYALLGTFRVDLIGLYRNATARGRGSLVWTEVVALAAMLLGLAAINWRVLVFYLGAWYLGQVAAFAENHLEHFGARPGNRLTDSVSAYGWLYNLIWFNNGYHQEHHYRPQVHWTEIAALRAQMLPETERHVVWGAHVFNRGRRHD